jgi:hypothetical protein
MNHIDSCLERLFRAAARAPEHIPAEAPFYVESALLAAWRQDAAAVVDNRAFLVPILRRALVCACAILAISAAVTLHSLSETPPSELTVVDSAIQLTLMQ